MITGHRIRKDTEVRGKFGNWMLGFLVQMGYTRQDFAKLVGISREQLGNQMRMKCKPNRTSIVAYCYYTGDDPEIIWKLVEEDWA